jgi:hypothetical protein
MEETTSNHGGYLWIYKIMRTTMFAAQDKAKPDRENIRGLNLAALKLTTDQVAKLPLYNSIR